MDNKPVKNPRYKGKNYNSNFVHPNANKQESSESWSQQVDQEQNPQPKPAATNYKGKPLADKLPLPHATRALKNPTPLREDPMFEQSIFGTEIKVSEHNARTKFNPSCASLIPITNEVWGELTVDQNQANKQMLVEGIRYYSTALMWTRFIQLKSETSQVLTTEEEKLQQLTNANTFNVPQPIYLWLNALGVVKCTSTGQTLIPQFPELPIQQVDGHGGYFGMIDVNNHNIYEEIPSLGVCAEALRQALSDAQPGPYQSSIVAEPLNANNNLPGFSDLGTRTNEARSFFSAIGVTENEFPETVAHTAFNIELMCKISDWIGDTVTFKMQPIHFRKLGINGAQAQTVISRPKTSALRIINISDRIKGTALSRNSSTTFGLAHYCLFQLMKENYAVPNNNPSQNTCSWSCVAWTGEDDATTVPQAWIDNRNTRRNIPAEYTAERFSSLCQQVGNLRRRMIKDMVIASRNH